MREIQIMSRLRHTNITGLIGSGSTTQSRQVMPFVLLERLDGGNYSSLKPHYNTSTFPTHIPSQYRIHNTAPKTPLTSLLNITHLSHTLSIF